MESLWQYLSVYRTSMVSPQSPPSYWDTLYQGRQLTICSAHSSRNCLNFWEISRLAFPTAARILPRTVEINDSCLTTINLSVWKLLHSIHTRNRKKYFCGLFHVNIKHKISMSVIFSFLQDSVLSNYYIKQKVCYRYIKTSTSLVMFKSMQTKKFPATQRLYLASSNIFFNNSKNNWHRVWLPESLYSRCTGSLIPHDTEWLTLLLCYQLCQVQHVATVHKYSCPKSETTANYVCKKKNLWGRIVILLHFPSKISHFTNRLYTYIP